MPIAHHGVTFNAYLRLVANRPWLDILHNRWVNLVLLSASDSAVGLGLSMISEEALLSGGRGLSSVANAKLGVQVA